MCDKNRIKFDESHVQCCGFASSLFETFLEVSHKVWRPLNMSTGSGEFAEQGTAVYPHEGSAHSSPSQLVPQYECLLDLDSLLLPDDVQGVDTPFLRIIEQPQDYYKFRYRSEMQNSHGCLHGKSYVKNSTERYFPGVELFNYNGPASIKCKLAQNNNEHEHPHRLCVNDISDISCEVPKGDSYKVWFSDLCIVHTPSREVTDWLYRGHDTRNLSPEQQTVVRRQCENMAKLINLNIVRLKFSAHHPISGEEICAPVFSDPIRNLKCAATNILKICRLSRSYGNVRGGDDVIMLVERVMKKNINIRFFELDENGLQTWTADGRFQESDVHHQYAIVFRTPPYHDLGITKPVQVFIELVRPSDGKKSDPIEFNYTPDNREILLLNKKRKLNHFHENPRSAPIHNYPKNFVFANPLETIQSSSSETQSSQMFCVEKQSPVLAQSSEISQQSSVISQQSSVISQQSSVISQQSNENGVLTFKIPVTPSQMTINKIDPNITRAIDMVNEIDLFENSDFTDYFDTLLAEGFDGLVSDTGRGKVHLEDDKEDETYDDQAIIKLMAKELQGIVEMIRIKRESFKKRLQALFDLRLSNGNTFLHLTLDSEQPLVNYIIDLVHVSNLTHLLNLKNASAQTILHQAVAKNLCDFIPFLVYKGCDPMLDDAEGNNAIHYGVKSEESLGPLLDAIKKNEVPCDLDAYNYEKQTPLHMAVVYKSVGSARLLLAHGASCGARDAAGRTPLHLAVLDDALAVAAVLLEHEGHINEVDGKGYTALQIVCVKNLSDTTIAMAKLLLEHKADPTQHQENTRSAWQLAKPAIRDLLEKYISADQVQRDSEDEFKSADEGDSAEDVPEISKPLRRLKIIT